MRVTSRCSKMPRSRSRPSSSSSCPPSAPAVRGAIRPIGAAKPRLPRSRIVARHPAFEHTAKQIFALAVPQLQRRRDARRRIRAACDRAAARALRARPPCSCGRLSSGCRRPCRSGRPRTCARSSGSGDAQSPVDVAERGRSGSAWPTRAAEVARVQPRLGVGLEHAVRVLQRVGLIGRCAEMPERARALDRQRQRVPEPAGDARRVGPSDPARPLFAARSTRWRA